MSLQKEIFEPFERPQVSMFICGPTVYDYSHLGHARIFIVYDVVARYLKANGYAPILILNLTDIDPKIFERAKKEHSDYGDIISKYTNELQKDLNLLNIHTISSFAMVSDYIKQAREHINSMLREGYAYTASGNVYFDTSRAKDYGSLSHQTVDDMLMRRIDLAPNKRNRFDFLVWNGRDKFDVQWESDFGSGIPWWHIQDSSVAIANFHSRYDIHCGAIELLYPHHEAHLAQMKVLAKDDKPVKYWVHAGMVNVDGHKMSKSIGNVVRIRDVALKYGNDSLRLYLLSNHYRKDIVFDANALEICKDTLTLLQNTLEHLIDAKQDSLDRETRLHIDEFYKAMNDDFDTRQALNHLDSLCEGIAKGQIRPSKTLKDNIQKMLDILGLTLA
jgi:cysteinyl-tRNA synthetase